jgi:hypothetical protein
MRQLATVAFKVVGLLTLVRALEFLFMVTISLSAFTRAWQSLGAVLILQVAPALVVGTLGLLLLLYGERLAERFVRDEPAPALSVTAPELLAIMMGVIGVYLIVNSLTPIARLVNSFSMDPFLHTGQRGHLGRQNFVELLTVGLRFAFGVALFFGAGSLARLWRRLHPLGYLEPPEGEPERSSSRNDEP